jgi:predicted RNA binding protein YcfA (HicA-like mRNA interferase family)
MPKFRTLSGDDLLRIFSQFGFPKYSQRGSQAKLRRVMLSGERQTLTIVTHKQVDRGTLHAICRQALRYVPESELETYFYAD